MKAEPSALFLQLLMSLQLFYNEKVRRAFRLSAERPLVQTTVLRCVHSSVECQKMRKVKLGRVGRVALDLKFVEYFIKGGVLEHGLEWELA